MTAATADVSLAQLRRIAVRAQLLDGSATDVLSTVRHLGFLQMDPIAYIGMPQHLVLHARLGRADVAAELDRLLWQERRLFEWDAFIWPVEELPLVRARMRRRRRHPRPGYREYLDANAHIRRHLLREIGRHGPVLSRDLAVDAHRRGDSHRWWGTGEVRLMLDVMQGQGDIAIAGRAGRQRLWDLAERVFPATETIPWREAERVIEERRRRTQGVWLERGRWHVHPDVSDEPVRTSRVTFLSPFDRLVANRDRAEALWGFHYRLEMYVPKAKRQYGYYVLPILRGDRVVGRIDVERDKQTRELRVHGTWWEDGVKPFDLAPALKKLQRFAAAT